MSVHPITAADALHRLDRFDAIIDARSESEFALDHLPGALNWPSLNDEERARVGTTYKQDSPLAARKIGAMLTARNIAAHIERELADTPRHWQPLVYCWRGGQRSGALALVLGQIGFRAHTIEGGYQAFRRAMLADIPKRVAPLSLRIICGPTGSGKTRLLHTLARAGGQVLDLEALAEHRASVLGLIPSQPQPTQKHFEMRIWDALRQIDPARPVFVEAESRKVGNVTVPEALMAAMRASDCLRIELPSDERVALLMEDYPFFVQDPAFFGARLQALVALRGRTLIERWQQLAAAGQNETVVRELLEQHYDPGYAASTRRNFSRFGQAVPVQLANRSATTLERASAQILGQENPVSSTRARQ